MSGSKAAASFWSSPLRRVGPFLGFRPDSFARSGMRYIPAVLLELRAQDARLGIVTASFGGRQFIALGDKLMS